LVYDEINFFLKNWEQNKELHVDFSHQ